jgi:hypothetical protein
VAYPGIFFRGVGIQQIQLRTEGRENGDLLAVAPLSGGPFSLQMSDTVILIRLLQIYFSTEQGIRLGFVKTSEFRGFEPPNPPRYATG